MDQSEIIKSALRPSFVRDRMTGSGKIVGVSNEGRMIREYPDGSHRSEWSITVTNPRLRLAMPTNIPSIYNGQFLTEYEAVGRILEAGGKDPETGRVVNSWQNIDKAEQKAGQRSNSLTGRMLKTKR